MRRLQVRSLIDRTTHLARRFLGFLTARPLRPSEQRFVADSLPPSLADLFRRQRIEDQRHAVDMALAAGGGADRIEAALLHDVGKSVTDLGAIGRALATAVGGGPWVVPSSWTLYRRHGPIGAGLLESAGASRLSIEFARLHPGPPPEGIDPDDWYALSAADDG